ncbi:MAG TPA: ATP-binding protein [Kofleriaceae bacterium]|nr:ATP-binding protein [Kofleriaceae bacterium]
MAQSQRLPSFASEPVRRSPRKELLRLLRTVDLECQTRDEAELLADFAAHLLPDPEQGRFGIMELLLNAIEHGNLEIGGTLKCRLLREQRFEDEIAARIDREPYRKRRVRVRIGLAYPAVEIAIRDDGPGFAWKPALATELELDERPNGRGILLARTCFSSLEYRDPGNLVVVRTSWQW